MHDLLLVIRCFRDFKTFVDNVWDMTPAKERPNLAADVLRQCVIAFDACFHLQEEHHSLIDIFLSSTSNAECIFDFIREFSQ